ncbi:hypothetical protein ACFVQ4_27400 [Streptomyces laurentii]|jgi:hypothetical protein|uniref:hypothetical protein n=1 Tax=Streptomyces laurentii TaxID=39478 RepID=UPI0036CAB062
MSDSLEKDAAVKPQDMHATGGTEEAIVTKDMHATSEPAVDAITAKVVGKGEPAITTMDMHATTEPAN